MGKKPSSRTRRDARGRKPVDRRPGGKVEEKEATGRAPRARQSSKSTRPSGSDRTSTSRRPPRDEPDDRAGRDERESRDDRENGGGKQEPRRAPPKGPEKEHESHWIDFATKEQKDIVHAEVNMFGDGDGAWEALVVKGDNNVFHYQKGTFTSIHLMPRDAKDRFKVLMGNPGLKHFGLFLGMFKGSQFNLSLEGASELAKRGGLAMNWIKLNDEGEKSFLYGQDIKKPALQEICPRGITHDRGICIILNARGECIGVGKLEARDPRLVRVSDDEILVKNVVDRGVYLRDQDRYA